jgi:hypothetical protein
MRVLIGIGGVVLKRRPGSPFLRFLRVLRWVFTAKNAKDAKSPNQALVNNNESDTTSGNLSGCFQS